MTTLEARRVAVVTGGAGFIGSHLCEALLTRLSMYRLRAKADIRADDRPVFAAWDGEAEGFIIDPRTPDLGGRAYGGEHPCVARALYWMAQVWLYEGAREQAKVALTQAQMIWDEWADADGNLGPVYGAQWRSWPAPLRRRPSAAPRPTCVATGGPPWSVRPPASRCSW